jgi:hypothetical protein
MHVGGDDVLDFVGLDADRLEAFANRMQNVRPRSFAAAWSKPVSTTKLPCGPLIVQT